MAPNVDQKLRKTSATNSVSCSQDNSDMDTKIDETHDTQHCKNKRNWSTMFPNLGGTMMTWVEHANLRIRYHASTICCTGDYYNTVAEPIPDEIIIKQSTMRNKSLDCTRSVTATSTATTTSSDPIELTTFEDFSIIGITDDDKHHTQNIGNQTWMSSNESSYHASHPWNIRPEDPVSEVSLKGSSYYDSTTSDEDDAINYKWERMKFEKLRHRR